MSKELIGKSWKHCVENDCYAVTSDGEVYRLIRRQRSRSGNLIEKHEVVKLSGSTDKDGYQVYRMMVDGVKKHVKGHRLVANAFLGENPDLCVNHIDGNKQNNAIDNLEWVTIAENNRHAIETGLVDPRAPNIKNRKVQHWDYVTIHALHYFAGFTRSAIAEMNGVSRQTIDSVIMKVNHVLKSSA